MLQLGMLIAKVSIIDLLMRSHCYVQSASHCASSGVRLSKYSKVKTVKTFSTYGFIIVLLSSLICQSGDALGKEPMQEWITQGWTEEGFFKEYEYESKLLVCVGEPLVPEKTAGRQRLTDEELGIIDAEGFSGEPTGEGKGFSKIILWDEVGGPDGRPKLAAGDLKIN